MIKVTNVSLRRGGELLFEDASFSIYPGHRVGVTGANGVGKTSLFKLLDSTLPLDSGDIILPSAAKLASVSQEILDTELSAINYVMAGDTDLVMAKQELIAAEVKNQDEALATAYDNIEQAGGYTAETRAAKLLAGLGFSIEEQTQLFNTFSGGWRMRLNLARALMTPSDILMLDEPTNHLDLDAIVWLENWLVKYQGMLIVISHDRDFLNTVTTNIINIENKKIDIYTGNYADFEGQRAARLSTQNAAYLKQQKDILHIQAFVDRFKAKASKAKQAQSRLKALSRMKKVSSAHIDSPFSFSFFKPEKMPAQLLTMNDCDLGYDKIRVLRELTLTVSPGDRIGLLGANGAGKSTFIKALANEITTTSGTIERANSLTVGYFAQHQVEQLRSDETPLEFLTRLDRSAPERDLRSYLGGFGFSNDYALRAIGPLSGGEKARLVLAAIVRQKPNLLLLDEPTNHLDLQMRHALGVALQGYEGALVVVSHDRYLLESVSDKFKLIANGRVEEFEGNLNDYTKWLTDTRSQKTALLKEGILRHESKRDRRKRQAKSRVKKSELVKRVGCLEENVNILSKLVADTNKKLADSNIYTEGRQGELKELLGEQKIQADKLRCAEQEWLEATSLLEGSQF